MKINFAAIKQKYDLVSFIEKDTNQQGKKSGKWVMFHCPFHDDRERSFAVNVNTQRFSCFANCQGSESSGDIIDYVRLRTGKGYVDAAKSIDCLEPSPVKRYKRPNTKALSMSNVLRAKARREPIIDYCKSRHVYENVVDSMMVGREMQHKNNISTQYVVIPNIFGCNIRSVKLRRDDLYCKQALQMLDQQKICRARKFIATKTKRPEERVADKELIDEIFGPRFKQWRGSRDAVFNIELLVKQVNGGYEFAKHDYVIVVEGEFDCMSMLSEGYPTVSIKQSALRPGIEEAFQNVRYVYIIQDNDESKIRSDGTTFNPGEENAKNIFNALGRGTIIVPPHGYKDANDLIVAGEIGDFMSLYGIQPLLTEGK